MRCLLSALIIAACLAGLGCSEVVVEAPAETSPGPASELLSLEDSKPIEPEHQPDFSLLLPSHDRKQLLIGLRHTPWIELWDLDKGKRLWASKLPNAAVHADNSPNGRWIAVGEALGSSPSDVILLDRRTGKVVRTFTGAIDYADVEFVSNSTLKADSIRYVPDGPEETIELTWSIKGGKPRIRTSKAERWPASPGEFPIKSSASTLLRSDDKLSINVKSANTTRLLCKSTQPYRLGAIMGRGLAVVTDTGSLFVLRMSDGKQIARFDCTYADDLTVTWRYLSDSGKSYSLADGLIAVSKRAAK